MSGVLKFRCDDAAGFELRIVLGNDSDLHLSVVPHLSDMEKEGLVAERYTCCYGASVRVRVPMIGGGAHEKLWHALAGLFREDSLKLVDVERRAIENAVYEASGNRTKAAELLGINVRTLRRKLNGAKP